MANEKKSISRLTDEATDKNGKDGWFFAIEEPNDLGNPTTFKITLDTLTNGFLSPDELGNTSFGGFNATDVNIFTVNTIQSYNTGKVSIDSPLESTIEDKHNILPILRYTAGPLNSSGIETHLLDADNVIIRQTNAFVDFTDPGDSKRFMRINKERTLSTILLMIDAETNATGYLRVARYKYNTTTGVRTEIATAKQYSLTGDLIRGTYFIETDTGALASDEVLLLDPYIINISSTSFSVVFGIQGFQ